MTAINAGCIPQSVGLKHPHLKTRGPEARISAQLDQFAKFCEGSTGSRQAQTVASQDRNEMGKRNLKQSIALVFAALIWPIVTVVGSSARTETRDCDGVMIQFRAEYQELATATCSFLREAKALMGGCGLVQNEELRLSISESARHPAYGECLGYFDTGSSCLEITAPERYLVLLSKGDARGALPPEVVYRMVVVHELAHALLVQTDDGKHLGPAEHEFVASAYEMAFLDPEWRDFLLEQDPVNPSGTISLVNPGIYALAPRVFANNAWYLFSREENGCRLVQRIVSGQFQFPRH